MWPNFQKGTLSHIIILITFLPSISCHSTIICTGSQWNLVSKIKYDSSVHWLPVQNSGMMSDWTHAKLICGSRSLYEGHISCMKPCRSLFENKVTYHHYNVN